MEGKSGRGIVQIIKGQSGLEDFLKKNRKRIDQIHFRPIMMDELQEEKKVGMDEIREFCESMKVIHDANLEINPLKEIKEEKIALFWCYTFDRDIVGEVEMYELEIGIKIVLMVEVLPEEYDDIEKRKMESKIKVIEDRWQPTERDMIWLKGIVNRLNVGGHWSAPMGFIFEKTGENELTLIDVRNNESLVAIYQTIKVGERANINIKMR